MGIKKEVIALRYQLERQIKVNMGLEMKLNQKHSEAE